MRGISVASGHEGRVIAAGTAGGAALGVALLIAAGVSPTWLLLVAAAAPLPAYFIVVGSVTRGLQSLLILSLSMSFDVFVGYSDHYAMVRPGIPITLTGLILLVLFVVWPLRTMGSHWMFHSGGRVTLAFGLFVAWAGASTAGAIEPGFAMQAWPGVITAFLIYLYALQWMTTGDDAMRFMTICVAAVVAVSGLLGAVQYLTGGAPSLALLGGRETEVVQAYGQTELSRVSGLLRHPNIFSVFLNGLLPLMLVLTLTAQGLRDRLLFGASFLFGTLGLVLTFSRGGWLAFAVSVMVVIAFIPKRKWRPGFGVALLATVSMIAIVLVLALTPLYSRVMTRLEQDDQGAAASRTALALTSLDVIREKPFTGVGLGNYQFASPLVVDDRGVSLIEASDGLPMRVHNLFLLTTAELGIPGLMLLVALVALFLMRSLQAVQWGNPQQSGVALGLAAGLVASLMHCMLEPATLADTGYIVLSFAGGCVTGLAEASRRA